MRSNELIRGHFLKCLNLNTYNKSIKLNDIGDIDDANADSVRIKETIEYFDDLEIGRKTVTFLIIRLRNWSVVLVASNVAASI